MVTEWACYRRRPPAEKKHGPDTEIEAVWSEREAAEGEVEAEYGSS